MSERLYSGEQPGRVIVREGDRRHLLDPRSDLCKHSSGFGWGTSGNVGPEQLSVALLADALQDDARALKLHERFRTRVITILPPRWTITRSRIRAHADRIEMRTRIDAHDGELSQQSSSSDR
jgi:hypothetical protein